MWDFDHSLLIDCSVCSEGSSCQVEVRAAHALANCLKRTRPHLYEEVSELQKKVVCCQHTIDHAREEQEAERDALKHCPLCVSVSDEEALQELEEVIQALLELRHKGQVAR